MMAPEQPALAPGKSLAGWRASFGSTQRTEQVDRVGDAGALFPSLDGDAFSDVFSIWVDSSLACERWRILDLGEK